jgi:2-dehydropantoate 2-reductase
MKYSGCLKRPIIYEWQDDANPAIWEKYLFIASLGLISACHNRTLGEILEEPSLKEEVIAIMNEIYSIALKKNIRLPDGIVDLSLKKAAMFPRNTQTSLQRDVHQKKGKVIELSVVRLSISGKNWASPPQ